LFINIICCSFWTPVCFVQNLPIFELSKWNVMLHSLRKCRNYWNFWWFLQLVNEWPGKCHRLEFIFECYRCQGQIWRIYINSIWLTLPTSLVPETYWLVMDDLVRCFDFLAKVYFLRVVAVFAVCECKIDVALNLAVLTDETLDYFVGFKFAKVIVVHIWCKLITFLLFIDPGLWTFGITGLLKIRTDLNV